MRPGRRGGPQNPTQEKLVKIIEAMKQLKTLALRAEGLRAKVGQYCANLPIETPVYPDTAAQLQSWEQSHHDTIKEISRLRLAIQRTNLATQVTIELGGIAITKCIAEWIHRRRDLAKMELALWGVMGDRGLKEQNVQTTPGGPVTEVRIRRYYEPAMRDKMRELYTTEPSVIDGRLEVTNAITDLIEA